MKIQLLFWLQINDIVNLNLNDDEQMFGNSTSLKKIFLYGGKNQLIKCLK